MIPKLIVLDPTMVDADSTTLPGAQIFGNHIRIHPDIKDQAMEGLTLMFGDVFKIITAEEFKKQCH